MQPSTLVDLCLDVTCSIPAEYYIRLPLPLKDRLLTKFTKRGSCTDTILSSLLHSHLTSLDLRDCQISGKGLACLDVAKHLQVLHLPQPPIVSDNHFSEYSLIRLGEGKTRLRIITLNGLSGVTDRVVGSLVGGCPFLQELHIPNTTITNHALTAIATLTHLVCLNIARTQVTDIGIQHLVGGGVRHSLQELRVDGCARLTDDSIETLCLCCSRLNILCFHHCPRVSERSRELLGELMACKMKQITWTVY
ncbi:protein AMN1 homolog [Penaeus vannamei]|uniref:Protein AMN1 n=1 Tax=Penaeus vannamei TaxID=6689 RepID=A0A3R7M9A7_PENVA|nr:protein AMN1 homolog [Penaeus vannamei]XP_027221098.1 protein AMN1 homolog [Penaeus vannamei]ROT70567.1 Protein AMN1 [Penaeus vannamei]